MSLSVSGGLTGGNIAIGYSIDDNPVTASKDLTASVFYNGNTYHTKVMVLEEDLVGGADDIVKVQVENAIIESLVEAILNNIDTDALAERLAQIASGELKLEKEPKVNFETFMDDLTGSDLTYEQEFVKHISEYHVSESPIAELKSACPGLQEEVVYPTGKYKGIPMALQHVIMNLNDEDGWSFAEIADWLDTLDIDLSINLSESEGGEE